MCTGQIGSLEALGSVIHFNGKGRNEPVIRREKKISCKSSIEVHGD